ncbi:hypothetical protein GCM10025884_18680 [Leuconostoc gelidum subsp. gelidum]|nr:hypothetical protein GCM10025884_18680 [Leuconostoc gelidum subsp. gelidum]
MNEHPNLTTASNAIKTTQGIFINPPIFLKVLKKINIVLMPLYYNIPIRMINPSFFNVK